MAWESLTPDEWIKLLGQILGPFLAATITGGLLVYQSRRNEKRDREKSHRELAESERKESRQARKELLQQRQDWAAVYQETLTRCTDAVAASERQVGPDASIDGIDHIVTAYREAVIHAQTQTARLFVVEKRELFRYVASALVVSINLDLDSEEDFARAWDKLKNLRGAFAAFLEELGDARYDANRREVLRTLISGSTLTKQDKERAVVSLEEEHQLELGASTEMFESR